MLSGSVFFIGKKLSLSHSSMEDTSLRLLRCPPPETTSTAPKPQVVEPPGSLYPPVDYLSRTRSVSAFEVWKALARRPHGRSNATPKSINTSSCATPTIREETTLFVAESSDRREQCLSSFNSATSQLVLERIMLQSDVSPLTSGRLSHSSGTLNISGSATSSPPLSPSDELEDDLVKLFRTKNALHPLITSGASCLPTSSASLVNTPISGARTVGRWLKDRREKKKEEARVHNAQLHAAVSVAAVAAAVAAITAATAAASSSMSLGRNDEQMLKLDMAVASAATLVAAQCVEAAEAMGAEREHLASVVSSAVNVRTNDDVTTLTAAAATALRAAATLKARTTKDVWNIAAVTPEDRGIGIGLCGKPTTVNPYSSSSGEILAGESFLGIRIPEFLASGAELLKRTRKGDLHWKNVLVYINKAGQVILKMKSRHVAGTVTKKDKNVVIDVCKDIPAWPVRHIFDHGQDLHYFGLKTVSRGVIEFECKNRREYDIWTHGVSRLLSVAAATKFSASYR